MSTVGTSPADVRALRLAAIAVALIAGVAFVVPGPAGNALAVVAVAAAVGAPLARLARVGVGFARERDWRFAALAAAVLAVVGAGAALAAVVS